MNTRQHVLDAIRAAGAAGLSGERLAGMLGVSRVAVGKHVAALRDLGYVIDAAPGAGYTLVSAPDRAFPWEVARFVHNPYWRTFEGGLSTVSTNDDARALALAGAEEGTVVVAARQEGGRGRFGRAWASPEGGAYVSCVMRPPVAPVEAGPLALVVALGIARGLETIGVTTRLKWPNDVKAEGRKLAGILIEMGAEGDLVSWVVAGFGLNVVRPDEPLPHAAYVHDYAPKVGVAEAAGSCLDGITEVYAAWLAEGFTQLLGDYEARSVLTGQHVVVRNALGMVRVSGVARGIDAAGRLLVERDGTTVAVASGEVTLKTPGDEERLT